MNPQVMRTLADHGSAEDFILLADSMTAKVSGTYCAKSPGL